MDYCHNLVEYQRRNIDRVRSLSFDLSEIRNVTVVAYYFRQLEIFDDNFWRTEYAILKTFETQGRLPTVLVVNICTPKLKHFCDKYSIELQIAKNLIPGKIKTLALDLIENLYNRFSTEYVLIIQDDGFPVRPGLLEFVGKYDYIGAPWVHHTTYYDIYPYKYCVGNGGFSLRSKRLCEVASRVYKKWFRHVPYWWYMLGDDIFYCKTLRFWFRSRVHDMKWPTLSEASLFSVERNTDFNSYDVLPLGFHGEVGWENIMKFMDGKYV